MWRHAVVGVVLVATSCMTDFPDLASDTGASGGQAQGGVAGGTGGSLGGNGGSGGSVGGAVGDASTSGGTGGTAGSTVDSGPDAPLVPGLLGHWPLDDASGNVAVDVIGGNDATLPASNATWTTGVFSGGIAFAAASAGVSAAAWNDTSFPATGTVTLWVKSEIIPNDTSGRGIFDNHDTSLNHVFVRRANGSPTIALQCAFQPGADPYAFVKTVPIASDVWQLVAVGWSSSEGFCYVNGNMQPGPVLPGWSPTEQRFTFGANYIGAIDDIRLYDHMLSVSELAKLLAEGP